MRTTKGFREFFQGKFNFPGKRVTGKTGSRVRISLSPQDERDSKRNRQKPTSSNLALSAQNDLKGINENPFFRA